MNEAQSRLNKIDPALRAAQWGVEDGSYIRTEYYFTRGKISRTKKGGRIKHYLKYLRTLTAFANLLQKTKGQLAYIHIMVLRVL